MTIERWKSFSKSRQMLMIGSEILRAKNWQGKDQNKFLSAIERALELIDFSLSDIKWRNFYQILLGLREELSKFYVNENQYDIGVLYEVM